MHGFLPRIKKKGMAALSAGGVAAFAALTMVAGATEPSLADRVVLVTLDGVRWQEMFRGTDADLGAGQFQAGEPVFPNLNRLASEGRAFMTGNLDQNQIAMTSNSDYISLPAYFSIFAGVPQGCHTNGCKRIKVETFPERLIREKRLSRGDVAGFGSWEKIGLAIEHVEGAMVSSVGQAAFAGEGVTDASDPELAQINEAMLSDPPEWDDARRDRYTYAHAMRYLRTHRPRFLYLSFNDSDEWGHLGDYSKYVETLRTFDDWIGSLIDQLASLDDDHGRRTLLVVTTDHGRGDGNGWHGHGLLKPESKYIWFFAGIVSDLAGGQRTDSSVWKGVRTHSDLRPTVEKALGLAPLEGCEDCGTPLPPVARGADWGLFRGLSSP